MCCWLNLLSQSVRLSRQPGEFHVSREFHVSLLCLQQQDCVGLLEEAGEVQTAEEV